jgi:hypothetical protein
MIHHPACKARNNPSAPCNMGCKPPGPQVPNPSTKPKPNKVTPKPKPGRPRRGK